MLTVPRNSTAAPYFYRLLVADFGGPWGSSKGKLLLIRNLLGG
jgi:hypothetical protein